ncbi:YdeI/OmpD-associated family protein [Actinotalea sp.]|uniref:YdeI/OmpD-associated family protein n=1 Tax=Actinotalea sp. TaxID=1872145 RepID=UPI002B9B792E|nr:YdeI/OmpD-associated family protein [Actinotalea sp.]HQY32452.1 YdeI/OmpD-associated family protein [Actinotalea sp.]HRA49522.1 YdeI/OmpD-associated family protein [Actinotalea sp.]
MRYRTTIALVGTNTGIPVPDDVVAALGQGRKPPVVVTVGGHTYRTTVASRGGQYLLSLSAANRAAAGVAGGDEVDVDIELDTAPREVEVPDDLAGALAADPAARAAWDRLAYSHRQRHVLAVEGAKAAETRARRVEGVLRALTEG